jgi:hypothetical protein
VTRGVAMRDMDRWIQDFSAETVTRRLKSPCEGVKSCPNNATLSLRSIS